MFSELHIRSAFSFLSSGSIPEEFVARAASLGLDAVALLDRDTLSGAVRFHFEAEARGVKAIIGAEITMDDGSLLPLVPLNLKGYQNLSRLITTVKLRHKKGEHFATRRDIEDYSRGLLCFTGGQDGFLHRSIKNGDAQKDIAWLSYVFEDRLYVELQRHYLRSEEDMNLRLLGLAHKLRIPVFASNGAYYADKNDRELFDVFTCIKNGLTIHEAGNLLSQNGERYLKSGAQMLELFDDYPEAVAQTNEIAARVDFSINELAYTFPDYPVPQGETVDSYLRIKVEERARERYRSKKQSIREQVQGRLDKELAVVAMKKLAGYFLVVCDISDFCRREKILSQGRGSAANSVICYSLGITAVDPIENQLLFERFLSEKYEQYPDIDIDLPSGDDREKVIQHVYAKYGERGAGMTANVICYRGKSAVREVGKVFGFEAGVLASLSKLNSYYETFKGDELHQRLKEKGLDTERSFKHHKFAEIYSRILDFPRHLGQHSGGMVISLDRLDALVPLEPASMENRSIIQWDKNDCEQLKIVKVDLLGLGMMAVLRDTITLVGERHGKKLDLYQIPNDDAKVYEALQNADTVGMFQVESRAQMAFLPKSKPRTFYDIVVQVAIIRPGPIVGDMLKSYIRRRQGLEKVTYPHESLKPILERTLGVPLFQEQLLKIAMDIADFTGGQAEELRRAMGFKRPDKKLEKIELNLRAGMRKNNIDEPTQNMIVKCVKSFANYGFPESHAYSFALLSYASAYFMVHYRGEFMTAMFNNYPLGFYSAATLVKDAQRHGLRFLPLDINKSQQRFVIEDECVRVGLNFVRGMREESAEMIVIERKNGDYSSVEDLVARVPGVNKSEVRALSMAGALNFCGTVHRRQALWESELALQPKGDLFADVPEETSDASFLKKMQGLELVDADIEKTGISIGKHPMAFIREEMNNRGILSAWQSRHLRKGQIASVAGAAIIRQRPMTAKHVVFITLEDETGFSNFIVMPDVFEKFRAVINQSNFLIIKGVFEERGMLKALHFEVLSELKTRVESHDFR